MEGRSLSDAVEEFLLTYNELDFLDKLCESLGIGSRFYTSSEITSNRSTGLKAEEAVREARDLSVSSSMTYLLTMALVSR